jgi:phosphatidylglycerol:prolipoprotein diacylglycerol transferase
MITFPQIDPVIFSIGPLAVRWYGLMYLLGFAGSFFYMRYLARLRKFPMNSEEISDLIFYGVFGVILGGRLGYTLFYNFAYYIEHPLEIFAVWQGGMSFHGGLLGVVVAILVFCKRRQKSILEVGDIVAAATPIGLGFGRLGNFINAELWGRVTDVPWGVVFPGAGSLPRHPSQLYEALLEGCLLFVILWVAHKKKIKRGVPIFIFLGGYGLCRFVVELFRQPDAHIGFLWSGVTMGQILSLPMIIVGLAGIFWLYKRETANDND